MKRGTSLHSRRGKADAPKGSPQINRRSAQDIQSGRPRSSSTTDAPTNLSVMEIASSVYVGGEEATAAAIERLEVSSLAQTSSAVASSTDGSINADSVDGTPDPQRTKVAITHLQQKILKLTEQIKIEQTARDDNVAEYLKLANNADKQQSARIKQVFEKKNQKSAQTILQLQKKLEHYHRKLREIEQNGIPRQPKDVFRDMHQGLKDVGAKVTGFSEGVVDSVKGGLSSFSQATHSAAGAVVSKPREIASLIRNKFGSADNIANLKDSLEEGQEDGTGGKALGVIQNFQSSPKYGSEEDCSSATSGSVGANSTTGGPVGASSSKTNTLDMQSSEFDAILHEIQEIRETQARLEESFEDLKVRYQRDYSLIMQTLQEERYRCERLEEQLNDLTELHQNEILNLKQELASMEEKIAYQSYERARDIQTSPFLQPLQCHLELCQCHSLLQSGGGDLPPVTQAVQSQPWCSSNLSLSSFSSLRKQNAARPFWRHWKHARPASPRWSCSSSSSKWCSWRGWRTPRPGTCWGSSSTSSWLSWLSSSSSSPLWPTASCPS
ncbi:transmembrane and coiled-coil domains protein 1 isoform X3 [Ciconia boyciana]